MLVCGQLFDLCFKLISGRSGEVDRFHAERRGGRNDLHGSSLCAGERGTQYFVTSDNLEERLLERCNIQLSGQSNSEGTVIESAAVLELVQKPEPLLRERQG